MPLFELLFDTGGIWVVSLGILSWIAYIPLSNIQDEPQRWKKALSTPWLIKTAVCFAVAAWAWNFGRLFAGDRYLRGSGAFPELSTLLLALLTAMVVAAWTGITRWPRIRPWLSYGLVLAMILSSRPLLPEGPETNLVQTEERQTVVVFIQQRLASLGCFAAVDEPIRIDGVFDALTASAVNAFQQANGLIREPKIDDPSLIRPDYEFQLLARPFPFLFGPQPCRKD